MTTSPILEKAERIRDVIRYIKRFKNATVVIYLDDDIIDSPLFVSHIRDIALIHQAGLRVILVPGARRKIDEYLSKNGISWAYESGIRITSNEAMPLLIRYGLFPHPRSADNTLQTVPHPGRASALPLPGHDG